MAALHYMIDYVLRTSPADLLPTEASIKQESIDHYPSNRDISHDQPLKKHFKDHIARTPELTHHGPNHTPHHIGTDERSISPSSFQRVIDIQQAQIEALERNLSLQKGENSHLREMVIQLKETIANLTHSSPRKRPASIAFDEEEAYDNVITSMNRKNKKQRAKTPELSDDDVEDEDYSDYGHSSPKRRRTFKSKEERAEASVFEEQHYGYSEHKLPTAKHVKSPTVSSETKFTLPSDIHLEKKYFLKWEGQIYAVAKAFGDRNRLRKLVAKYESETDKKASYLLDGEELRKLKAINPICHNTSYLGLYNLEFVRYFQNVVSA